MKILEKFLLISRPGRAEIQWTKTLESQTLKKKKRRWVLRNTSNMSKSCKAPVFLKKTRCRVVKQIVKKIGGIVNWTFLILEMHRSWVSPYKPNQILTKLTWVTCFKTLRDKMLVLAEVAIISIRVTQRRSQQIQPDFLLGFCEKHLRFVKNKKKF